VPVLAVLTVHPLVLQDGGLHLSNAVAWRGLVNGWWPGLLEWRTLLAPNMTVELALLGLTHLLSGDAAVRIVVAIGLVGYAAAVAVLMRVLRLSLWLGIPLLAFQMNFLLMMGSLGFVWAVPLALGALALALLQPHAPPVFPLSVMLMLSWLTHIAPALIATVVIVLIVLAAHLGDGTPLSHTLLPLAKYVALPAAPVIVLSIFWLATTGTAALDPEHDFGEAVTGVLGFAHPLVAYTYLEYWCAGIFAVASYAAVACAVLYRVLRQRWYVLPEDGLLGAALLLIYGAVMTPENSSNGAGFIATRLSLFGALVLTLWLAAQWPYRTRTTRAPQTPTLLQDPRRRLVKPSAATLAAQRADRVWGLRVTTWWAAAITAALTALVLPLIRLPALQQLSGELDQIRSLAPCLPSRSTFVQLNLDDDGALSARGMHPLAEQIGYLAVERQALDLGNESGWEPFYVWRYPSDTRADQRLGLTGPISAVAPDVHLADAIARGWPLDAVVLYGRATATGHTMSRSSTRTLLTDLDQQFWRATVSSDGRAELWLRRGHPASC
jgi:hypothetical protein